MNYSEKILTSIDIVVISVSNEESDNQRKNSKKMMSILLEKRNKEPFKDRWGLPGGLLEPNDTLVDSAKKVLKKASNISNIYIEQLYTFDNLERDPRGRVISTSYVALIDKNRLKEKINNNVSWFNIINIEDKDNIVNIVLNNGKETLKFSIRKKLREKTTDRYEFYVHKNECLAFDHPIIILSALERIKSKSNYTDIVFNMMPKYFTLGELQQVYEVILGKQLLKSVFRRVIASKVKKTNKMKNDKAHRPSSLYTYNDNKS